MRYIITALLFCAVTWLPAAEDWHEDIELVPFEEIAELLQPYRPSLITRARAWMDQHPELAPHIQAHLSELYHDARERLEDMDEEDRAAHGQEAKQALAVVEMEMAVAIKSHLAEQAAGAERAKLLEELRRELEALFDQKLAEREREISHIEAELAELREQVAQAKQQRQAIIERKLAEIGGGPDVFEW